MKFNKGDIQPLIKDKLDTRDFLRHIPVYLHHDNITQTIEEICEQNNLKISGSLDNFRF